MNLLSIAENCKAQINQNPNHHLEREYRNEFFDEISDIEISLRLLLNVAIKTTPIFARDYPDNFQVHDLIEQIKLCFDNKGNETDLLKNAQVLHTHLDDLMREEKFNAIYAGLASVFCAYEVVKNEVMNDDEDEFNDDPDNWSSCFFASLAYCGGAGDVEDIDPQKNKEFWYWFLDDALALAEQGEYYVADKAIC